MDEKQSYPKDIHAMDKKMSEVNFFFTHTGPDTTTGFIALKTRAALNIMSLISRQFVIFFSPFPALTLKLAVETPLPCCLHLFHSLMTGLSFYNLKLNQNGFLKYIYVLRHFKMIGVLSPCIVIDNT